MKAGLRFDEECPLPDGSLGSIRRAPPDRQLFVFSGMRPVLLKTAQQSVPAMKKPSGLIRTVFSRERLSLGVFSAFARWLDGHRYGPAVPRR